jgi:hypothetical protein
VKSRSRAITFGTGNFHGFWTFWSSFHLDCLNIQGVCGYLVWTYSSMVHQFVVVELSDNAFVV